MAAILHNPFYVGLIRVQSTGEVFAGVHEPLIPMRQFEHVQAVLAGRVFARPQRHEFPLRRLLRCGGCGRALTGEVQKTYTYYRCHSRPCRGVSLSETVIDQAVRNDLALLHFDEVDARDFRDLVAERIEVERASKGDGLERLRRDLANIDDRVIRLTDALIDGSLDKEMFDERKRVLLSDRQRTKEAIAKGGVEPFWEHVREKFERGITALDGYDLGSPARKREVVQEVCSNLVAMGKQPVLTFDFPYADIRNWNEKRSCDPTGIRTPIPAVRGRYPNH